MIISEIQTSVGSVPIISTELTFFDMWGSWKARWGINRMDYKINPGLYAVGNPDNNSHVFVTCNYKMTFDVLRKELSNIDAWILVLDTKGINVWCAAAKGTFSTEELINRIADTKLAEIVAHKTLILPQLGAVGVNMHEVLKKSKFKVVYGPVKAKDIKKFVNSKMEATKEMRTVKFGLYDRLVLIPLEIVLSLKPAIIGGGILFLLNLIGLTSWKMIDLYAYIGAIVVGCVVTPILLPWIPGRAFAWKGWLLGVVWTIGIIAFSKYFNIYQYSYLEALQYVLVLPPVSAFLAMNFTGTTTYTSLSGVLKEMKIAIPLIITSIILGIILIICSGFIKL